MMPSKPICEDSPSFPKGSTVAIQNGDGGPWMNGILEDPNNITLEILQSQSDENRQTYNTEHMTHMQHPNNYRAILLGKK